MRKYTVMWDLKRRSNASRVIIIQYKLTISKEKVKCITAVVYDVAVQTYLPSSAGGLDPDPRETLVHIFFGKETHFNFGPSSCRIPASQRIGLHGYS